MVESRTQHRCYLKTSKQHPIERQTSQLGPCPHGSKEKKKKKKRKAAEKKMTSECAFLQGNNCLSELGHNTVRVNGKARPSLLKPQTSHPRPCPHERKEKRVYRNKKWFGNMHFCKATTASKLGHNINKTKNVENEMPYQLHFKTAQEHNTQNKT